MSHQPDIKSAPHNLSVSIGASVLQRKCACGRHTTNQHGQCTECRKKRMSLQRRAVNQSGPDIAPSVVHEVLRSPGRPLDPATRAFMGARFGRDFSGVRIHTDERAAESAQAVNALAYTVGQNVIFGAGQYALNTSNGQRLLMHELTHVVQQRQTGSPTGPVLISPPDSPHEHEAATVAASESASQPIITSAAATLQRQPATRITAPIPRGAVVNRQGQATFQINNINVIAEPDRTSSAAAMRNRAETTFGLVLDRDADGQYDSRTNTVTSVTPPQIHATVVTTFGPGYDPRRSATYGRGTTLADRRARTTNLGFHESRHGADWFEFLRLNAAPVFNGRVGMSLDDFQKAREQFHTAINAYNRRAQDYTKRLTDCTGTLPTEPNLATFCRQQRP